MISEYIYSRKQSTAVVPKGFNFKLILQIVLLSYSFQSLKYTTTKTNTNKQIGTQYTNKYTICNKNTHKVATDYFSNIDLFA